MPPNYALENLRHRRLKISRFADCNDPFELEAVDFSNRDFRLKFRGLISDINRRTGLICFSKSWHSSIMWSHYAAKHKGICLALDVNSATAFDIAYASRRLFPNIQWDQFRNRIGPNQMKELTGTKSLAWAYEEEVRMLFDLRGHTQENGMYFAEFGDDIQLKQVYLGPQSQHGFKAVSNAISDPSIPVIGTRRAFQTFEIVQQLDRTKWPQ